VTPLLRPLGFGELLDRAFVLAMRTVFHAGAAIAPTVGVGFLASVLIVAAAIALHAPESLYVVLSVLSIAACSLLGAAAVLSGQIESYLGHPVRFGRMFASAGRAWPQLTVLALLFVLIVSVPAAAVVAIIEGGAWVYGHAGFFANSHGDPVALLVVIPFLLAVLIGYGFLLCVGGVACVGCIAEGTPALDAWLRGWDRSVSAGRARRTFFYGGLLVLVGTGLALVLEAILISVLGVFGLSDTGETIAGQGILTIFQFFYVAFMSAWFVVYYFDLRVRSEGLDLAMQSESVLARSPAGLREG
jgi:hypothetical protein